MATSGAPVRALILSNMFPTLRSPGQGIFISRRLTAHREAGDDLMAVALRPTLGKVVGTALAVVGRRANALVGTDFVDVPVPMSPVDVIAMNMSGYASKQLLARAAAAVFTVVGDKRFDIVHAHGMYFLPAGAVAQEVAKTFGVPYVISAHGSDINAFMPARRVPYIDVLDRAASVAYVSDALRDRAIQLGASGHNALTAPNGVDTTLFSPAEGTVQPRRCIEPIVTYVGNLAEVKGADFLPGIFKGILARVPDCRFVVVGDGPLRAPLEDKCRGLPVRFEGAVAPQRVAAVMREAQLMLLPSRSEGWPCVVLEAHATETPILAADVGGAAQAVNDPKFVVAHGLDFLERFVMAAVQTLRGELIPKELRPRSLDLDWRRVAARETEMLKTVVAGGQARRGR